MNTIVVSHNLLSICIPTYNFGRFIGKTLDSILPNLKEGVEVVILDGGSTDDTGKVVAQRQKDFPQIKYFRQEFRGGIDRDIAKVVGYAQSEYCWLFSADDIMKVGAIEKVIHNLQSKCDIYLCEHTLCDFEINPITEYPIFNTIFTPQTFNLGDIRQRKRYFNEARTSEAFFSFLSGPIFKRDVWEKADGIPESFYGTCWALAGRLLLLVDTGLIVHYLGESLIYKRGGNDSFLEHGVVNRLRISIEGFTHIAETIFGKSSFETHHIRRVIRNERPLRQLLMIKLNTGTAEEALLNRLVLLHYSDAGFRNTCKYLLFKLSPITILKFLRLLKRITKNLLPK